MPAKDYILKEEPYLISLRRWFHANPEPSLQEYETCKKIAAELSSYGVEYEYVGETAIAATIKGAKPGKIIALRADTDALNMDDLKTTPYASKNKGCCHACGHDAHTAALLAAAKVLKEKQDLLCGEVRLFFQPAEEIGQGARLFINAGLMKDVWRVFALHITSRIESGKVSLTPGPQSAGCDYFKIQVTGKGTHVSTPEKGVDALYTAAQIVNNLQSIVSRNTSALDTVVVGVGHLTAGTQYNIVAEHAVLEGTTRTFTHEIREATNNKVCKIATETAALFGATATVEFKQFALPLINHAEVAAETYPIAAGIVGAENIITNNEKALGADDFADFLALAPGLYAHVGTRSSSVPNSETSHHHGLFDIDEKALVTCCALYVEFALWALG